MTHILKNSWKLVFASSMITMFIANYEKAVGDNVSIFRSLSVFSIILLIQIIALYMIKKE